MLLSEIQKSMRVFKLGATGLSEMCQLWNIIGNAMFQRKYYGFLILFVTLHGVLCIYSKEPRHDHA